MKRADRVSLLPFRTYCVGTDFRSLQTSRSRQVSVWTSRSDSRDKLMQICKFKLKSGTVSGLHGARECWFQVYQRFRRCDQGRRLLRDRRGRLKDARRQSRPRESCVTRTQGHLGPGAVKACGDTNRKAKYLKRCARCIRASKP